MIYFLICISIISMGVGFLLFRFQYSEKQRKRDMPFIHHWLFEMSPEERSIRWDEMCKRQQDFWAHEFVTKSDEELEKEHLMLIIRVNKGKVE